MSGFVCELFVTEISCRFERGYESLGLSTITLADKFYRSCQTEKLHHADVPSIEIDFVPS